MKLLNTIATFLLDSPHLWAASLALVLIGTAQSDERPNIVFIMADDMGYGDVQALNPESKIPTPNLNRLAAAGMTFTDAHSPSAVCTPTRYATLTGRYSWRSRLKRGVLNGYGEPLIEKTRPTVASHLQASGYQTAAIGKWHLGLGFQKSQDGQWDWAQPLDHSPVDLGFDRSLVIPASLDFPPYVYIEGHSITGLPDRTQPASKFPNFLRRGEIGADFSIIDCLDQLANAAEKQIADFAKQESPFFLYFPLTAPHKPAMPHSRFQGKSKLGPYGDFVMQVDEVVGRVQAALVEAGVNDNTLLIYTSDNGSYMYRQSGSDQPDHVSDPTVQGYNESNHRSNADLRGTKADIWEAGHRVPFLAAWPKAIAESTTSAKTICHVDLFATAAELANTKLPKPSEAAPDSFSFVPLLKGNEDKFKRVPIVHHSGSGMFALRDGDWKLVFGNGSGGREKPSGKPFQPPFTLFNLENDPGETSDVASGHPEQIAKMQATLLRFLANEASR